MNITLYENKSDMRSAYKDIRKIKDISGHLKEECSLIDPIILIEKLSIKETANLNYIYIPDLGRYYFAKVSYEGVNIRLECHSDVLCNAIKRGLESIPAVIGRQSAYNDMYYKDELQPILSDGYCFSKNFPFNLEGQSSYVLITA